MNFQKHDIPQDVREKYNDILKAIPATQPLLLFPLRLETKFRTRKDEKGKDQKQLCVRFVPDDIMLDYCQNDKLSVEEVHDGKFFWLQWFIASGCEKREYEAWESLCLKYPLHRAAWIARRLKLTNLKSVYKGAELFYRRPYVANKVNSDSSLSLVSSVDVVEEMCREIYTTLSNLNVDERHSGLNSNTETVIEREIREKLDKVSDYVFEIESLLSPCQWLVDYLYDSVHEMGVYLRNRLEGICALYEKYPSLAKAKKLELWDVDHSILTSLVNKVDNFLHSIENKRITLEDMVKKYLDERKVDFEYDDDGVVTSGLNVPVCNCLPDRFLVVVEQESTSKEKKVRYELSKSVLTNKIQIGIDPNKKNVDDVLNEDGELKISSKLQWLTDYDVAEDVGMAVSITVPKDVEKINYIYVVGIRSNKDKRLENLRNIFFGHNYINSSMRILNAGVPTNIVEGEYVNDEEMMKRARYEIEIEEKYENFDVHAISELSKYDAGKLASLLKPCANDKLIDDGFKNLWGRIVGGEGRQSDMAAIAYKKLWELLIEKDNFNLVATNKKYEFVKDFFINHVRARGNAPAIQIDNLPYGILPISDFWAMKDFAQDEYIKGLLTDLLEISKRWQTVRDEKVICSENMEGKDVFQKYLEMATQTPYSISYTERMVFKSLFFRTAGARDNIVNYLADKGTFFNDIPVADVYESFDESNPNSRIAGLRQQVLEALTNSGMSADIAEREAAMYTSEFLDLMTFRLDAWFSGILDYWFTKKQNVLDAPYLGTFGWAFDLRDSKRTVIDEASGRTEILKKMELTTIPKTTTLYRGAQDSHFIMAPSIQHALSSVVLRSAYLKSKGNDANLQVCVNLSSMRARQALRLIDGVKSGMSLSIILGSDLERYLHEAYLTHGVEMDEYIYPLRQLFPQVVDIQSQDERAADYILQTINAEALLKSFINQWDWTGDVSTWLEEHYSSVEKLATFVSETKIDLKKRKVLFKLIERLMDSYDALNDLLLSEGVHRLIMGDKSSFYAISSFLAEGTGNLPDPEILKIPSEHVVVCHKAGLLLPSVMEVSEKVMRLAEPALNSWVEQQLGGMENVVFFVKRTSAPDNVVKVSLADLNINGLEYMYLSAFEGSFVKYLETRWRLFEKYYGDDVEICFSSTTNMCECKNAEMTLADNKLRIDSIRDLVAHGRALNVKDCLGCLCEDVSDEEYLDSNDVKNRFEIVKSTYVKLKFKIETWLAGAKTNVAMDDAKVESAFGLLCECYEAGLVNCLDEFDAKAFLGDLTQTENLLAYEESCKIQQRLRESLVTVCSMLVERIQTAENQVNDLTVENCISAMQSMILNNFKVFPLIKLNQAAANLNVSTHLRNVFDKGFMFYKNIDAVGFNQWQDEVSEVRDGMKVMNNLSMIQTAVDHEENMVAILQSSIASEDQSGSKKQIDYDKWLGCAISDESELRDADSLVLYNSSAYKSSDSSCSGFVFDSWIEYIPYKKHDAGFAFHNDWPDNEAPQSMLLAWNSKIPSIKNKAGGFWDIDALINILPVTSFMMKNRAVEPDHIYADEKLNDLPLLPHEVYNF